jgi:hypothetical protein
VQALIRSADTGRATDHRPIFTPTLLQFVRLATAAALAASLIEAASIVTTHCAHFFKLTTMATDLIMPRPPDQQHATFYPQQFQPYSQPALQQQAPIPAYPPQQPYNPPHISPLSSANASPTSPRSNHGRQNRPLFMPAVLRPTEFPSKAPPQKLKAQADAVAVAENDDDRPMRSSGSFMSLPGLNGLGRLSRRSTGDRAHSMFGNLNLAGFPTPKGAPSQQHWKVSLCHLHPFKPQSKLTSEPFCPSPTLPL